jgi:probable rRNA maturation factor
MIEINNLTNFSVDKKLFSTVAKNVLKGENRETETISLAFIGEEEIKKINKKFRKKNKATDVLSFEISARGGPASGGKDYLGEIIICPEVVKENAKKYGVSVKKEMLKVFIHGILHLCGYDHEISKIDEEKMEEKQNFYLSKIK